jgi:hypothetical protein
MVMLSPVEIGSLFLFPGQAQPHEISRDIEQEGYRNRGQLVLG